MSRRRVRLLLVPAVLFVVVWAAVFTFAKWHPAKRASATPTNRERVEIGDPARGELVFAQTCATCHGEGGEGGGVGPRLVGNDVSTEQARSTIENGSGLMPPNLVTGQDLEDVLAYLDEDVLAP
jgi:menaquinol-cytochrome c reductase cytochrome b/c subunit